MVEPLILQDIQKWLDLEYYNNVEIYYNSKNYYIITRLPDPIVINFILNELPSISKYSVNFWYKGRSDGYKIFYYDIENFKLSSIRFYFKGYTRLFTIKIGDKFEFSTMHGKNPIQQKEPIQCISEFYTQLKDFINENTNHSKKLQVDEYFIKLIQSEAVAYRLKDFEDPINEEIVIEI